MVRVGGVAWVVGLLSGMVMMIGVAEGLEAAQMCTQCKIRKCKLSETLNRGSCIITTQTPGWLHPHRRPKICVHSVLHFNFFFAVSSSEHSKIL